MGDVVIDLSDTRLVDLVNRAKEDYENETVEIETVDDLQSHICQLIKEDFEIRHRLNFEGIRKTPFHEMVTFNLIQNKI